jgi:hypothetical protein
VDRKVIWEVAKKKPKGRKKKEREENKTRTSLPRIPLSFPIDIQPSHKHAFKYKSKDHSWGRWMK